MPDITPTPPGYAAWLAELKTRIHSAQQRAALAVNRELVLLYWQMGQDILARQAQQGWGAKVIERLAQDLRAAFPDMKGFSRANLMYMRAFAQAWSEGAIVQQAVGQLPWGHNLVLLTKLKAPWCSTSPSFAGTGRWLRLCGATGASGGGRRRFFHRPALLPSQTALASTSPPWMRK